MTDTAPEAMDATELRALIRDMIPWLDEATHAQFVNALRGSAIPTGTPTRTAGYARSRAAYAGG